MILIQVTGMVIMGNNDEEMSYDKIMTCGIAKGFTAYYEPDPAGSQAHSTQHCEYDV